MGISNIPKVTMVTRSFLSENNLNQSQRTMCGCCRNPPLCVITFVVLLLCISFVITIILPALDHGKLKISKLENIKYSTCGLSILLKKRGHIDGCALV